MKKIIFSAMVAFVAIGGAFASNSLPSTIYKTGPLNTPDAVCTIKDLDCSFGNGFACTFSGVQQYATDGGICILRLQRP